MATFNKTAAAKSALFNNPADTLVAEAFKLALARGLDKVWKREFEPPRQGEQFLRAETIKRETATYQTYRQMSGLVPQNRDTDELPFATTGDGFGYTVQTYNYRRAIQIEQTLIETDDVGVIRGRQADLARMSRQTIEHAVADIFNRGIDDGVMTNGSPVLSDDGLYLVDADRPNADPDAGSWSNLESTSAITPGSIFQAQLNARAMTGEDGELFPTMIKYIICRPQDSKTLWEIRNSQYRPTDAMNVTNYFKENAEAHFDIKVYDYMTAPNIYYGLCDPKSEMNELAIFWRVKPNFKTWVGDNPDVQKQRVRMAWGFGLGSPRKAWRGGLIG